MIARSATSLALVLAATILVASGATAAAKLTSKNSFPFPFATSSREVFSGADCGTTASITKTLPPGAIDITVREPKVGDRDETGGGTQVTAVTVTGTAITITVLADGPTICDPAQTGYPPGETVYWTASYDFRAEYTRRVQATIRVYYESYIHGAKWKMRPKTIHDSRAGAAPGQRVTGIKWKRFGGRKAIGYGTLRQDYCRPRDNCPQNGKRIRLVASKPDYCKDSDRIEYLRLAGSIGKIEWFGGIITCSA
jgi:hypothetical protein